MTDNSALTTGNLLPQTRVEQALLEAWGDIAPRPFVHKAQDPRGQVPALIDFTILDLRIGLQVWSNTVTGFVSHRLYCTDAFAGRVFQDMSEEPLDTLTLPELVRSLREHYVTILANVPRENPLDPDTPDEIIADEEWQAERQLERGPATYSGMLAGLAFALAAVALWWFLSHR